MKPRRPRPPLNEFYDCDPMVMDGKTVEGLGNDLAVFTDNQKE